jgi:hypothetical protein
MTLGFPKLLRKWDCDAEGSRITLSRWVFLSCCGSGIAMALEVADTSKHYQG